MATKPYTEQAPLSPEPGAIKGAQAVETLQYTQDNDSVPKDYAPEGFSSAEDFLSDMRDTYQLDIDYDRINRDQALDDKQFAAGEQWDPVVLEQRAGLPCLVINSVPQFTAQLVGDWRESRKAVKVVPSDNADTDIASVRGDLIRSIELQSRATRIYDATFESTVQCGDGAFRVSVEYARNDVFDQDIFIRPIDDALSVVWDRMSVDPTGRDANHVFVDDLLPRKEFCKKWPDSNPSTLSTELYNKCLVGNWIDEAGVKVTEYWRMVERDRLLCLFQDGSVRFLDKDNHDQVLEQHGPPIKSRVSPCTYAQMHLVTGFEILSGPYEYQLSRLPIIRMTGRTVNVGGRRIRYGLVRFMKDPVRLRNFWRSVAAEQLGYAPKAQWMATQSAVEGREEDLRKAHLSRDPLIVVNDEAEIGKTIQRIDPPPVQEALLNEANVNAQDMKDVTGIHDASLGIRSNETSGRAINARQREGDIASLTFYDNGNEAVLEGGDVINQLISQVYDGTRTVRTIGPDEEQKFVRINDPMDPQSPDLSVGMYDVALTTGTSYTTRRVEAAQAMMEAIQVYPQLMQIAPDIIVKAQDWPGADKLADRLKKTIPPQLLDDDDPDKAKAQGQMPSPEEIQKGMQELEKLRAENVGLKADREIDMMKVEIEREKIPIEVYNAETQRIRALSDNMVDGTQLEQNAIAEILAHSRHQDEIEVKKIAANKPRPTPSKS